MKKIIKTCAILLSAAGMLTSCTTNDSNKASAPSRESFNSNWKFARFGAMPDGSTLAEPTKKGKTPSNADFNDNNWRSLDLPHDWGIEGPFRDDLPRLTGKLPWHGIGWYRKSFNVSPEAANERHYLDIDGAMSDSTVFVNGKKVGGWPYGYSSYRVELTEAIKPGVVNTVAIRLDNKPLTSRWYPGGGIYRDVHYVTKPKAQHIAHCGIFAQVTSLNSESATVKVTSELVDVIGSKGNNFIYRILDTEGNEVLWKEDGATTTLTISKPQLWTLEDCYLYKLEVTLLDQDGAVRDTETVPLGLRTIAFDADRGFLLNGKPTYLKGVCMHHDLGPIGTAFNVAAARRQISLLKEMGVNAIRTAHNPPAKGYVELCDEMGILLQIEAFDCWDRAKQINDYARFFKEWHERDLSLMVRNFRNNPSVIMWSIGNEIRGYQNSEQGVKMAASQRAVIRKDDTTRPVTMGLSVPKAADFMHDTLDVIGLNYKPHLYAKFKEKYPKAVFYGSETSSCYSSRGEYFFPVAGGRKGWVNFQVTSYDVSCAGWGCLPDKEFALQDATQPHTCGEFVWTGFDYIGEPIPYLIDSSILLNFHSEKAREEAKKQIAKHGKIKEMPSRSAYFGMFDLCGFKKDRFYLYQSRWMPEKPMVHILPHWNWQDRVGKITPVHIYTSGDEVELFLNGKSLGRKKKGKTDYRLRWDDVVYQPGELKAISYKNGKKWAEKVVATTGKAAQLKLEVDRKTITADGSDLSFVTVTIADNKGVLVPRSHNKLKFEIEGPGEIIATGNGDATNHTSFNSKERKAFNGLCLVVIRSKAGQKGKIKLTAVSEGLKKSETIINSK